MRRLIIAAGILAAAAIPAFSQDNYPSKTISLVVAYTAGGGTDTLARLFAAEVSKTIGQKVIVDNRPGANGNVGTDTVAAASPDGYTILLGNIGPMSVNPSLYAKMNHDPATSLAPVTELAEAPLAILISSDVPAQTLQEFVAYAKENPDELSYASAGSGTSNQLAAELLNVKAGTTIQHIPYRGAAQAMTAVVSGEVQMFVAPLPSAMPHLDSGKVRALAVTGTERSSVLPMVPTATEAGFPGVEMTTWYGILAPKGTPDAVINKLNEAFSTAAKSAEMKDVLHRDGGAVPIGSEPTEFGKFMASERAKWAEVVKTAKISIE